MAAQRKARGSLRDRLAARRGLAWAVFPALAGLALLLLAFGNLLLDAFPVTLRATGDATSLRITVEGDTRVLPLASPLRTLRFAPLAPNVREYQVDGSDTTNNFTFDAGYFASFAASPYYRFQALLRDEGSYSRWRNLVVRDPAGRTALQRAAPEGEVTLPEGFDLSLQLRRLETPRTLELLDDAGTSYGVEVNRNDRYVTVTERAVGQAPKSLARWYFPNDWQPPAAELAYMALRVAALAIALLLLLTLLAALLPVPPSPRLPVGTLRTVRRWEAAVPLIAAGVALAGSCYSAVVLFDRAPHILDAVSYYFQAKIFASGSLAAPAPPLREAFPTPFSVVHDGLWFSQYTPGTSLLLAAGFLLQLPWLVEPILAAAVVLLLYQVGRRQFGTRIALLATVLMATSPFLWLMAGSFMSHVPSTFFAAAFLYAATRYLEKPSLRWIAIAALALGFGFLVREATAVLYAGTVGSWVVWKGLRRRPREMLRHLALAAAVLAVFGTAYLLYDWVLTGSPWVLPRMLFSAQENSFGFGDGVGFYGRHTPAAGLVNADEQLTSLTIVLFGWPFYFSLALMALPFLTRLARGAVVPPDPSRRRWDLLHGAVVGAFVAAYLGLYYHGIALGPRYYFDALPSMVLLSARGFATLAETGSSILQSATGRGGWWPRARTAALVLAGVLLLCNLLYFVPRQVELYRGFTGLPGGKGPELAGFVQRDLAGRRVEARDALITTDDWWIYSVYLSAMNSPRLEDGAVLALMPSGEAGDRLRAAYPGRNWYRVVLGRDGKLSLEWEGVIDGSR